MIHSSLNSVYAFFYQIGDTVFFIYKVIRDVFTLRIRKKDVIEQAKLIGYDSLPIAMVISFFIGLVLALQTGFQLQTYGLQSLLGPIVGLSLIKEMSPVMMSILFTARSGSAMAAQIGTMIVAEEVDALRSMGINPLTYLAVPRVLATTIVLPLLTMHSIIIGFFGGAIMSNVFTSLPYDTFFGNLYAVLKWQDLLVCLVKSIAFGLVTSLISCSEGFRCKRSAAGVGLVTTRAVVLSFVVILIGDYYLTRIMLIFL